MPKTRFWPALGGFWPVLGPGLANLLPVDSRVPKNPKFKNISCFERFCQKKFRLLKHPKRLGLGQKVPGKDPFGPNEPRFMGPKDCGVQPRGILGNIGGG